MLSRTAENLFWMGRYMERADATARLIEMGYRMAMLPGSNELDEWRSLYRRLARANGGEPDAGRRLLSWARRAGFREIISTASTWCYATPEARAWWSGVWSERIVSSAIAEQALASGHATEADLRRLADGWRAWGAAADGWFAVLHGEILCQA